MDWRFSVPVSTTGLWHFPPLGNVFGGDLLARHSGDQLGVREVGSYLPPFVRAVARQALGRAIGEPEQVRGAILGIARPTGLGDLQKAQRDRFPDRWCDGMAVDAVGFKVVVGDRQLAVIGAAMARHLDLDAVEHAPR
jgi:hypothetical protein